MLAQINSAQADDYNPDTQYLPNRTTYGDLGIIEMPSARMAPDGQLSMTADAFRGTQRYALGFQVLPWLEGSFRYSRIEDRRAEIGPDYDRSFGLKMRLFQEGEWMPELSLGIRDLVGTGIYSQEYLVATKSIWTLELTGGIGWGRLAADDAIRNPLGLISDSFYNRPQHHVTGQASINEWFHGQHAGIFGGAIWHTPIENLDLTIEYSSDRYARESNGHGPFRYKYPVNFGVAYHPFDWMSLSTEWLYGDAIGFTISIAADPTISNFPAHLGPEPISPAIRSDEDQRTAVADFVNNRMQSDNPGVDGPWVSVIDQRDAIQARLTAELTNPNGEIKDFEIDGQTLLINLRDSGSRAAGRCKSYALLASNARIGISSVAVTDLSSPNGAVAVCEVPKPIDSHVVMAALRDDQGDPIMPASSAQGTADAPPGTPNPTQRAPVSNSEAERKVRFDADAQSLRITAISIGPHEAVVYLENDTYFKEAEAIGRLVRVLMADAPPNVEVFRIVSVLDGVPVRQTRIERSPIERMFQAYGQPREVANAISLTPAPAHNPVLDANKGKLYPAFSWSIFPQLREGLFDPNSPIQFELTGVATAGVTLLPGLSLDAGVDGSIWNDYDLRRSSNSKLPHVRSDAYLYLRHGINGIDNLSVDYMATVGPDIYIMGRAGILEDMFAGGGAQILWRPSGQRWAVGADVYQVWQRGFDRLLDLQHYNVLTGHVSVYYQSPWYGLDLAVHAGRYLAGDYGATFEVTRRFDTGIEVGAFATFTNVPFHKFGEGSFDKGIIVNIPLEWMLPFFTQSSYNLSLRPLSRDGGQRLAGDDSLYGMTLATSENEIASHIDDIAYPPR